MVESCVALRFPAGDVEQMVMPLKDIWHPGGRGAAANHTREMSAILEC